jgi:hypothetical protein
MADLKLGVILACFRRRDMRCVNAGSLARLRFENRGGLIALGAQVERDIGIGDGSPFVQMVRRRAKSLG